MNKGLSQKNISGSHLEQITTPSDLAADNSQPIRGWQNVALKWRIATLTALLLTIFATLLSIIVIANVTSTLEHVQQKWLQEDTAKAQHFFENAQNAPGLESRALGSSRITLFSQNGDSLGGPPLVVPANIKQIAATTQTSWSDHNGGQPIRVLLTPIQVRLGSLKPSPAVLVVWTDASYIQELSSNVRNVVMAITVILIMAALLGGYAIASIGLRPLVGVARQAMKLDEHHLKPLTYNGARDELGLLTTTLNQMVKRLKRSFAAQKTFLAETSHELRTPLTALQGYLGIAIREATPTQKPLLEDAKRVTESMTRLVGDLLQLSRGEVVEEWIPHVVDLSGVVQNIVREIPGVNFKNTTEFELIGDPDRLAQLVRNLVSNAVRAAGKPEGVHIRIVQNNDMLELHVQDDGAGIPEDVLPRVFEKFYKGPGGGAGLGLAIVAQIARVHGGQVYASNDFDAGAHFLVSLPALPPDTD